MPYGWKVTMGWESEMFVSADDLARVLILFSKTPQPANRLFLVLGDCKIHATSLVSQKVCLVRLLSLLVSICQLSVFEVSEDGF